VSTGTHTIAAVLERLDAVVADCRTRQDRHGLFVTMYRGVTRRVHRDLAEGRFRDPAQMELLDARFADRYFEAWDAWQAGSPPTRSWAACFESARGGGATMLQDLLLGMNAHINLDLGVSTAEVLDPRAPETLKPDFDRITDLLVELLPAVQTVLNHHSPWLAVLDLVGGQNDEQFAGFTVRAARRDAWDFAMRLAGSSRLTHREQVDAQDARTAELAARIRNPGGLLGPASRWVQRWEKADVPKMIDALTDALG